MNGTVKKSSIHNPQSAIRTLKAGYIDSDRHERAKRLRWYDLGKLQKARVLVVGAGALGNEVAKDLVLEGFRRITLVDIDRVVTANLNRCVFFSEDDARKKRWKAEVVAAAVGRLDPQVKVKWHTKRIEEMPEKFIPAHDIVLGCVDNVAARLHINAHAYHFGIPYIDGGTLGMVGKVQVVIPPRTACVECGMNRTHMKVMQQRFSCTGREVTFYEPKLAAEITTTSIIAAVQVREAMKVILGAGGLVDNLFYYDGLRCVSEVLEVAVSPDCPHHDSTEPRFRVSTTSVVEKKEAG